MNRVDQEEAAKQLSEIKSLMEGSSRFLSLSGLSGVFAGLFALAGVSAVWWHLGVSPFSNLLHGNIPYAAYLQADIAGFLAADALIVLCLALGAATFFTIRKGMKYGYQLKGSALRQFLLNLMVPLAAGGVFVIFLVTEGLIGLAAPATLVFYGLALVNAGKYTLKEIRVLGYIQTGLGLVSCFFSGYGLLFWAIGFGILHIIYGILMYYRYDRTA